jgi:hypothetical protein
MADLNAAATLQQAQNFATEYAGATLEILNGATVCATVTIASFTAANSGQSATATAAGVPITEVISNTANPVNGARLVDGTKTWTLSVGTSGAEVNLSTLNFIAGQDFTLNSLVITFPA